MSEKPPENNKKVLEIPRINLEDYKEELSGFAKFQLEAAEVRNEVAAMEKIEAMMTEAEKGTENSDPLKTAFILTKEEFEKLKRDFNSKYDLGND